MRNFVTCNIPDFPEYYITKMVNYIQNDQVYGN